MNCDDIVYGASDVPFVTVGIGAFVTTLGVTAVRSYCRDNRMGSRDDNIIGTDHQRRKIIMTMTWYVNNHARDEQRTGNARPTFGSLTLGEPLEAGLRMRAPLAYLWVGAGRLPQRPRFARHVTQNHRPQCMRDVVLRWRAGGPRVSAYLRGVRNIIDKQTRFQT